MLRFGGYLETVVDGETGVFFDTLDPTVIALAIDQLEPAQQSPTSIRAHAARFDEEVFATTLRRVVTETTSTA